VGGVDAWVWLGKQSQFADSSKWPLVEIFERQRKYLAKFKAKATATGAQLGYDQDYY
jgi:hypothetical protein